MKEAIAKKFYIKITS